jgi:hypothetical protein
MKLASAASAGASAAFAGGSPAYVHEMVNQRTMASEAIMPQPDGRVESVEWPLTMSIFS